MLAFAAPARAISELAQQRLSWLTDMRKPGGGANASDSDRWVAYFSYMRPRPAGLGEVDGTHFEATRSLFS